MPKVICKECGAEFHVRPARIASGRGKFCSRECASAARKVEGDTRQCAWCGREFVTKSGTQKYCSRSCSAVAVHAATQMRPAGGGRKCACCGRLFMPREAGARFCGEECRERSMRDGALSAYSLFEDPWETGAIPPDRYGKDMYRMPDIGLGF